MESFLLTTIMSNSLKNINVILDHCDKNDKGKCKKETTEFLQCKLEEAIKWGKKHVVEEVLSILFFPLLLPLSNDFF